MAPKDAPVRPLELTKSALPGDTSDEDPPPDSDPSPIIGSARCVMWVLMAIPWLACHCVRRGMPLMIEFIVREMGFSESQKAQVRSFTPPPPSHPDDVG